MCREELSSSPSANNSYLDIGSFHITINLIQ